MSENAAAFVGDVPGNYDSGLGPVIFADYAEDIARRAATDSPRRVLETAAGTGIVTRKLRDALPATTSLTATDLNVPMLEVARRKFRAGEAVEFKPADAGALPFEAGAFDRVVCQFGVMFFPDKPASFREVRRVLAPGGRYVFNVWDAHRHNPFGRIAHEVAERFFRDDLPPFYRVPFGYHAIDPIKDALGDAGFTDLRVAVVAREKRVADVGAFARGLVHGNPIAEQIRSRGGDPDPVVAAIEGELRGVIGPRGGTMPLQAIVVEATRP